MPTFAKKLPEHKPFGCCAAWHLRGSGNMLAIYDLIGKLTGGGKMPFFSTASRVTLYFYPEAADDELKFKSAYETVRKSLSTLRKLGFLKILPDRTQHWVHHEQWAKAHPDKCNERDLLPWQFETDPLVGRLYAIGGGKIALKPHVISGLRRLGSDEEIEVLYGQLMKLAEARRVEHGWSKVNPGIVLWSVRKELIRRNRARPELVESISSHG